jgi:hypothetical protein
MPLAKHFCFCSQPGLGSVNQLKNFGAQSTVRRTHFYHLKKLTHNQILKKHINLVEF